MLGSGINPESFKQDYSGFTRAAEIQAQGLQNLGQSIGGAIESYGEMKKRQQEDERAVQKSKNVAKAIGDLIPDLKPTIQSSLTILDNKELPLSQRKAEAEAISDILNLGIGEIRNRQSMQLERDKMGAESAYRQAQLQAAKDAAIKPLTFTPVLKDIGDGFLSYKIGSDGNNYDDTGNLITDMPAFAEGQPIEVYSSGTRQSPADAISSAANMPTPRTAGGLVARSNAINNATPLPVDVYTDDTSQLPPVGTPNADTPNPLLLTRPEDAAAIDAILAQEQAAPVVGQPPASIALPPAPVVGEPPAMLARRPELRSRIIRSGEEKQVETFRPATAEESALYGGVPGQMSSKGRFYPINLPSGMTIETDPSGGIKVVQGAGVGSQADKTQRAEAYKVGKATELMKDLNLLESGVTEMAPGVAGAAGRMIAEQIPATLQAERKKIIDRVKATLTVGELQAMRNSSPTGASLGNISNTDVGLLLDSATLLSNALTPEAFKRELVRLKNLQHNIIYGSEQQLRENLQKGKITQSEFDESMRMTPSEYINDQGVVTSRSAPSTQNRVELSPEIQELKRQREARIRELEAQKQAQ